jgi:cyclin B
MLHYLQNHNFSDYNINDESKNNSTLESKYLHFLNEQNKENLDYKNNMNIYEENSKIINSKKLFKINNTKDFSEINTFDKDVTKENIVNQNKNINENIKRNVHNIKILNNYKKVNSTINDEELFSKKERFNNLLLNIKNKIKDDQKYIKYKKAIFEKASKKLNEKVKIIKEINSKIIKLKTLDKKFTLKKQIITKILSKKDKDKDKENKITVNCNSNLEIIDNYNHKKEKSVDEKLNIKNKNNNIDISNINHSKHNKSISYKFNEKRSEDEYEYIYFDISKIKTNAQIPKEYINIIYHNLLLEENKGIIPYPDYSKIISQKEINEQMRSILIDWIIDVHFKFNFTDETLFMTVLIIDRYISYKSISKKKFQLLGITALLISCKHEEIILPKIEDFIYITDNAYVKEDVFDMENDILDILSFNLIAPSPIKFYEYLALKFEFDKKKFLLGKYLMESFMVDINYVKFRASVIACASIYIVMKYYKMKNYKEAYNKKYYNINENDISDKKFKNEADIKECAKDICIFVDNVNKTNFLSCKNKYASDINEKVSLIISGDIE